MSHRRGALDNPAGLTGLFFRKIHQHEVPNGTPKKAEAAHEYHQAGRALQPPKPPLAANHALG